MCLALLAQCRTALKTTVPLPREAQSVLHILSSFGYRFWYSHHPPSLDEKTIDESLQIVPLEGLEAPIRFACDRFTINLMNKKI